MAGPNPYESSEAETAPELTAAPSLQIAGLRARHVGLLLIAIVGVAAVRMGWAEWVAMQRGSLGYSRLANLAMSVVFGAAIAATVLFVRNAWATGVRLPTVPGHGYLLCLAALTLLEAAACLLWAVNESLYPVLDQYTAWNVQKLFLCGVGGVLSLLFASQLRGGTLWRLSLVLPGVVLLALCPMHVVALNGVWRDWFEAAHAYSQVATAVVVLVLLFAAIVADRDLNTPRDLTPTRDWVHHLGVGVFSLLCVLLVFDGVYWLQMSG